MIFAIVSFRLRHRATGSVAPAKMGGYRKPTLEAHKDFIVERIEQTPHLTLHGLKDEILARGVKVSHNAVWLFLRREGLTFKKTSFALEQARTDVEQQLLPILEPGNIVVMDNLGSHTSAAVRRMIRAAGARLGYLPPYSPDLNPIEQAFAKIKHWMRQAQKRTIEDSWRHIGWITDAIEPGECAKYLRNAGYASVKP